MLQKKSIHEETFYKNPTVIFIFIFRSVLSKCAIFRIKSLVNRTFIQCIIRPKTWTNWRFQCMMTTGWFWSFHPPPSPPHLVIYRFVVLKVIQRVFILFQHQGGCNLTLVVNEKKVLKHTGDYILVPFLEDHDYVLVPSSTSNMVYHYNKPECLQEFQFLMVLKQPEVWKWLLL